MQAVTPVDRYMSIAEVLDIAGISRQTLYRWCRDGLFPPSRKIGISRVGFLESEVREWLASREIAIGPSNGGAEK